MGLIAYPPMLVEFDNNTTRRASEHAPNNCPGDVVGKNPVIYAAQNIIQVA